MNGYCLQNNVEMIAFSSKMKHSCYSVASFWRGAKSVTKFFFFFASKKCLFEKAHLVNSGRKGQLIFSILNNDDTARHRMFLKIS